MAVFAEAHILFRMFDASKPRLPVFWLSGTTFRYGNIQTTNIDMAPDYSISNLHDPLFPQDAATKKYIDDALANLQSSVRMVPFLLNGQDTSWITEFPDRGTFICMVTGKMTNGPTALFLASKSKTTDGTNTGVTIFPFTYESGNIHSGNQSGAPGSSAGHYIRLTMSWSSVDPDSGKQQLQIAKTMDDPVNDMHLYDGNYEMVFLGADGLG